MRFTVTPSLWSSRLSLYPETIFSGNTRSNYKSCCSLHFNLKMICTYLCCHSTQIRNSLPTQNKIMTAVAQPIANRKCCSIISFHSSQNIFCCKIRLNCVSCCSTPQNIIHSCHSTQINKLYSNTRSDVAQPIRIRKCGMLVTNSIGTYIDSIVSCDSTHQKRHSSL